jgi:hypothetical protein
MDFARQEARAEVSPSHASPPQLPPSPKIRPCARRQSQAEQERGEGGVRREPGERGENGRRSPGSQLGFPYQTRGNSPSGPGRPFFWPVSNAHSNKPSPASLAELDSTRSHEVWMASCESDPSRGFEIQGARFAAAPRKNWKNRSREHPNHFH